MAQKPINHPDKQSEHGDVPNDAGIASVMASSELFTGEPQPQYAKRGLIIG